MDDDAPLLFTPLVRQPGIPVPDWLFGPGGMCGLPAPLSPPQGVNIAVGIDIIEVDRVRKVYERHGERFLKRVFTEMEVRQCRGKPPVSFFFSSRRRHTRSTRDWSSDVCSSD